MTVLPAGPFTVPSSEALAEPAGLDRPDRLQRGPRLQAASGAGELRRLVARVEIERLAGARDEHGAERGVRGADDGARRARVGERRPGRPPRSPAAPTNFRVVIFVLTAPSDDTGADGALAPCALAAMVRKIMRGHGRRRKDPQGVAVLATAALARSAVCFDTAPSRRARRRAQPRSQRATSRSRRPGTATSSGTSTRSRAAITTISLAPRRISATPRATSACLTGGCWRLRSRPRSSASRGALPGQPGAGPADLRRVVRDDLAFCTPTSRRWTRRTSRSSVSSGQIRPPARVAAAGHELRTPGSGSRGCPIGRHVPHISPHGGDLSASAGAPTDADLARRGGDGWAVRMSTVAPTCGPKGVSIR